jgi:hypothetical protein
MHKESLLQWEANGMWVMTVMEKHYIKIQNLVPFVLALNVNPE